ncbi:MAG: hypothetical protein US69_C0005G0038 [candidate division TM6 bacterium GW2011_GWF2_38_10]|nr:MAG: hypothetical protein US69_C0005G0038 [candidate division TM6 bacterium GW2011_GWF2_38_10]
MNLVERFSFAGLMVVICASLCCASMNNISATVQEIVQERDIASIEPYVSFLRDLQKSSPQDVSSWFETKARELDFEVVAILQEHITKKKIATPMRDDLEKVINLIIKSAASDRIHGIAQDRSSIESLIKKYNTSLQDGKRALSLYSLASWLWQQVHKIFQQSAVLRDSFKILFQEFPYALLVPCMHSPTLKSIIALAGKQGDIGDIFIAWDAIKDFVQSESSTFYSFFARDFLDQADTNAVVLAIMKDFTGIIAVFMDYMFHHVSHLVLHNEEITSDELVATFIKVSTLSIIDEVAALCDTGKQLCTVFDVIKQGCSVCVLGQWLKQNWFVFPITIGVIVIKIMQYFQPQQKGCFGEGCVTH